MDMAVRFSWGLEGGYSKRRFTEESKSSFEELDFDLAIEIICHPEIMMLSKTLSLNGKAAEAPKEESAPAAAAPAEATGLQLLVTHSQAEDKRTWLRALSSLGAPLFLFHPDGLNMLHHSRQTQDLMCSIDDPIGCSCVF